MGKKTIAHAADLVVDVPEGRSTVRMKRNAEQWPVAKHGPSTAEVHVDEIENWAKHGWEMDEEVAAPVTGDDSAT
jgi:hypothetical protein